MCNASSAKLINILLASIRLSNSSLSDEKMFGFHVKDVTISFSLSWELGYSLLVCFGRHVGQFRFHLRVI